MVDDCCGSEGVLRRSGDEGIGNVCERNVMFCKEFWLGDRIWGCILEEGNLIIFFKFFDFFSYFFRWCEKENFGVGFEESKCLISGEVIGIDNKDR